MAAIVTVAAMALVELVCQDLGRRHRPVRCRNVHCTIATAHQASLQAVAAAAAAVVAPEWGRHRHHHHHSPQVDLEGAQQHHGRRRHHRCHPQGSRLGVQVQCGNLAALTVARPAAPLLPQQMTAAAASARRGALMCLRLRQRQPHAMLSSSWVWPA